MTMLMKHTIIVFNLSPFLFFHYYPHGKLHCIYVVILYLLHVEEVFLSTGTYFTMI